MKKLRLIAFSLEKAGIKKWLITMKLIICLTLIGVFQVQALVHSQESNFTLNESNINVREVIKQLENKSNYRFFFSENLAHFEKPVNIHVTNANLKQVLDYLFKDTPLTYRILENDLVIIMPVMEDLEQGTRISGTITDANGNPLPGVNIVEAGTTNGAVTDLDGNYSITVSSEDAVLRFSFVGYLTEEIEVGGQTNIDVTLIEDIKALDEVVVIGYGSRQQRDLTGAVSNIGSEDIEKSIPSLTPELAMQGNMPGVFVSNPGSDPTARPEIRIRGVSTLGYNDPLYVIDGVPITEGGASGTESRTADLRGPVNVFSMINPNDIESISVLKDASATAIYGVRASNGVILITTKRGESGKMKINVSASYGIQNLNKRYDVTNVQDYVMLSKEAWENNTTNVTDDFFPLFDEASPEYLGNSPQYTKDWEEAAIKKNAVIQDYNLSISGGNEISNYALGGNYAYHEDVLFKSNVERYSFFINSDHQMTKWLKVGETLRLSYNQTDKNAGGNLGKSFVVPWQPLYDENGLDGYALPGREIEGNFQSYGYGNGTIDNDFGSAIYEVRQRDLLRSLGSLYAEVSPLDGLRIKGTYSFDYYTNTQQSYNGMDRGYFEANRGAPYEDEGNGYRRRLNENINLIAEFLIGYNQSFGKHNFDLILNVMDQRIKWNTSQSNLTQNSNIPNWEQRRIDDGLAPEDTRVFYERTPSGLQGYMSRLSYNYGRKYYLDATVRRDGTSKFGPGYKWGTFPSFALAWRISDEPFMNGISWLTDLKFRGGWGQTGNQETRAFAFLSSVDLTPLAAFGSDPGAFSAGYGNLYSGATLKDFPVVDMSWETVTSTNFGFDSRLFDGKIDFTAEYYYRLTDGILQSIQIPLLIGAINQPVVNLAQVENSGFEFSGIFRENLGEFGFSASFNLTTVKNNVLKLYENRPYGGNQNRIEVGYPVNYLYGYRTNGIFQTEQEVTDWLNNHSDPGREQQKSPGDVRFVDIGSAPAEDAPEGTYKSDVPDGKIDAFDQTYLGKTIPGYYYGLSLGVDYKGFDLFMNFRGVGDVQKAYSNGKRSINGGQGNYLNAYLNRWTPVNPSNTIPRAIHQDPSGNNRFADRYIEDANFFRFQSFQLGYTFKGDVLTRLGATNARIYLSGGNLFVITPYSDLDPENNTTPTSFTMGVNLSF